MSIKEELIKHQAVLTDSKSSSFWSSLSGTPTLTGQFEGREVQLGVRQVSKYSTEVFFKFKLESALDLPFMVWDYCPLVMNDSSELQRSNVRIEGRRWLTEIVRPQSGNERFFQEQTDEMLRGRLSALSQLARKIETEQFSLEGSIAVFKKNLARDLCIVIGVVGLFVAYFAISFYFTGYKTQGLKNQQHYANPVTSVALGGRGARKIYNDSDIFLKAVVDKTTVYPNEQIILTYDLYTRYDSRYEGFEDEGRFRGFWMERIAPGKDVAREVVQWQGRKFVRATIRTIALFPISSGKQIIHPGSVKASVRKKNNKKMDMLLTVDPVEIMVKDFPLAGKPVSFSGVSSDHLEIDASLGSLQPRTRIMDFVLTFKGNGNLWGLQPSVLNFGSSFSLLKTADHTETFWTGNSVTGRKTFIFTLLSKHPEELSIPPVLFSYFVLSKQTYETLSTKPITIRTKNSGFVADAPELIEDKPGVIILVDVSGSMLAEDFQPGNRLSAAKNAVRKFVDGNKNFKIGISVFAKEVLAVAPLDVPSQELIKNIEGIRVGMGGGEDGTAIGDAVLDSIKELKQYRSRRKIIVLLSDGSNNAGHLDALSAADLAKQEHVVIYAIGLGKQGFVPFPVNDPAFGKRFLQVKVNVDDRTLKESAEITGGKYFKSEDGRQLDLIFKTIGDAVLASNK